MKRTLALALGLSLLSLTALAALGQDKPKPAAPAPAAKPAVAAKEVSKEVVIATQLPSYPLATCPVSGEKLSDKAVDYVTQGRLVRLCCKDCIAEVEKAPAAIIAKVDAAVIAAEKASYPLKTCPISGKKLGEMGDPVEYVHGTRLVRFCCGNCTKAFEKNPEEAMKAIDTAYIAAQKPNYKLTTCVVSGEKLGEMGDPVDYLYGTRLVRFCCKDCVKDFNKTPAAFLAKLEAK
jgi:YHS domain-containing protein